MNRATWKVYYRLLRICRREAAKASIDMMSWGTGYVVFGEDGLPHHVPLNEVYCV